MYKLISKIYIFFLLIICNYAIYAGNSEIPFINSFINSYDIENKYTHEYHPYVLDYTSKSFTQLRNILKQNNLEIESDVVIFGYQEDGIPAYTTDWSAHNIADEAVIKTKKGLESPARNAFGFLTGFLLKDLNWLEKTWRPEAACKFLHIRTDIPEFFKDSAVIFQKHVLKKYFETIVKLRDAIEKQLYKDNILDLLSEIIKFWRYIYSESLKDAKGENFATQDILFSIAYAQMLLDAGCNISNFFIGPDITYPIEKLSLQNEASTANAQKFIKVLQEHIRPVKNEPTAYIFGSFVDGVGKSTLLNNIKNYAKYGDEFELYQRCDNSSSQKSDIYRVNDKIFLVDLPAQVSHFAIKPEGCVYVDI